MPRYVFDVTALRQHLSRHSQLTGIQRVSVMILDRARRDIDIENVWLGYHDRVTKEYMVCPCPRDSDCDLTDYRTLCDVLRIKPTLRSLPGMDVSTEVGGVKRQITVWTRDLHALLGDKRYFTRRNLFLEDWRSARARSSGMQSTKKAHKKLDAVVQPGDRLILLDNAWNPKGLEAWLVQARTRLGLNVCIMIHDLIPIVRPQYTPGDMSQRFHDWLTRSTSYVTCYMANSDNTGRDLRQCVGKQKAELPVKVVPLAQAPLSEAKPGVSHEHAPCPKDDAVRIPDHIRTLTKVPYVLVVGTLEVRKNLWQIAIVWDRLRQNAGRPLPKLVFAGGYGWLNNDFDKLMQATGQLGGWAEIIPAPSDNILAFLYRNCLFTITASFYEGWGLPIGESLAYGKTAVVSETSAMPEVGGDMVEYCDPHSLDSIEAACLRLIDDPDHRIRLEEKIALRHLRSWNDVAHDMVEAVQEL